MATRTRTEKGQDAYMELIRRFPLRPVRSDQELDQAIRMMDSLIDKDRLTSGEKDYLDVLSDLVEHYETEHHPLAPASDAEMLGHLIEAKGVTQADVARAVDIAESTISEVLSGRRNLSRKHIGRLASYFQVEPGVFRFES